MVGTDEELEARLQNFDSHISEQKRKKKAEDGKKQDLEDELSNARRKHVELLQEQGSLRAEAKVNSRTSSSSTVTSSILRHKMTGYLNGKSKFARLASSTELVVSTHHHWRERRFSSLSQS